MPHTFARRSRNAADKSDHRLRHVLFNPERCLFFGRSADFPDHDDRLRAGILIKQLQNIDEL
ncbi:hypothetical protein D3C73_1055490 [compost metagenome]